MATVQTKLLTAEEFYEWANRPEHRDRVCELERGEIVEMSRPGKVHGLICANVARILGNYAEARGQGYVCSNDTGVVVERNPDTVRGPDVMFFDDAQTIDQVDRKYGESPPLLAVEVISPNDTTGKMMLRITEQLRFGAKLVWLLDPDTPNVTVFRQGKEPYALRADQELTGDDVLPEFRSPVARFFQLPAQRGQAAS